MTEDRTLIISLGQGKEYSSRQVGTVRYTDTQVVFLIAEELNVEGKQPNQIQGISLECRMS